MTPLITTHEPPSTSVLNDLSVSVSRKWGAIPCHVVPFMRIYEPRTHMRVYQLASSGMMDKCKRKACTNPSPPAPHTETKRPRYHTTIALNPKPKNEHRSWLALLLISASFVSVWAMASLQKFMDTGRQVVWPRRFIEF